MGKMAIWAATLGILLLTLTGCREETVSEITETQVWETAWYAIYRRILLFEQRRFKDPVSREF